MTKYTTKTALSLQYDEKRPWRTRLVLAGREVELTDEQAKSLLERGAIEDPNAKGETDQGETDQGETDQEGPASDRSEVTLPARPSNNATTAEWRTYAEQLNAVTSIEMDPMEIPADATRAQLIELTDQRVTEWNED